MSSIFLLNISEKHEKIQSEEMNVADRCCCQSVSQYKKPLISLLKTQINRR